MKRLETWQIEYARQQLDTLRDACVLGDKQTIVINLEFIRKLNSILGSWLEERKEFNIPEPEKHSGTLMGG